MAARDICANRGNLNCLGFYSMVILCQAMHIKITVVK